ncbi:protein FlhE [Rosenbergiella nectarea]|uniref:Protein FlhE n=1 Tax=Rosenbergiella nectarea TaxID=988801 RepID=A0A1H9HYA5_9GAMM|nr:flagellar protein FlhE [Rosenbergiella nectarea]SEQ67247.1 protein FlhE [Rosenbergiella nectarea]
MWRWLTLCLLFALTSGEGRATMASASLSQPGQRLMQKGQWYSFHLGQLPKDYIGTIRSLSWQINSAVAWPKPPTIFLCLNQYCQRLDTVAGRSMRFAGLASRGEWQFKIQLPGYGAQQPPIPVLNINLTVNSHIENE